MFDATLVDVGIGLALIFFIVAAMVAAMNEVVTRLLDVRAKVLWKALAHALDDDQGEPFKLEFGEIFSAFAGSSVDKRPAIGAAGDRLVDHVANTSLVKALGGATKRKDKRTKVDQMAASTFTSALLQAATLGGNDLLATLRQADGALARARKGADPASVIRGWDLAKDGGPAALDTQLRDLGMPTTLGTGLSAAASAWRAAADADAATKAPLLDAAVATTDAFASAMQDIRIAMKDDVVRAKLEVTSIATLRAAVGGGPVGEVLDGALATGTTALVGVTNAVNEWFDAQMARVGELYARATKVILFAFGLGLAILFNVNAITLPQELRDNADARAALVAAAASCPPADPPTNDAPGECAAEITKDLKENAKVVSLPIVGKMVWFWDDPGWPDGLDELDPGDLGIMVGGWLLTAGAVSFGAPFWYDVVQRLTANRSKLVKTGA
jgi:hypothetical protein